MSQQLIYTSAPRGLKPGSRGFCTVATTPGMAANLADRLESLSGYRHVSSPGDARNPINYSYLSFTLGGRRLYVLSRVADAGLDYTQRSNKIAHHVVLEQSELSAAGPAALLMHPDFMESAWSGEPRALAPRMPPQHQVAPQKCALWEQLTGDAGWGGYLAAPPDARPGSPVIVIYRPDMAVLPLLAESMALLPPEQRWQVTFSTYYTKLPPGIDCQWRCVLEGSAEAEAAARLRDAVVIRLSELVQSKRRAPEGLLVEATRTGRAPRQDALSTIRPAARAAVKLKDDELEAELLLTGEAASEPGRTRQLKTADEEYRVAQAVPSLPPVRPADSYADHESTTALHDRLKYGRNRKRGPWLRITAASLLVLIAGAAVTAVFLIRRDDLVGVTEHLERSENNRSANGAKRSQDKSSDIRSNHGPESSMETSDGAPGSKNRKDPEQSPSNTSARPEKRPALDGKSATGGTNDTSNRTQKVEALLPKPRTYFVELPDGSSFQTPPSTILSYIQGYRKGDLAMMNLSGHVSEGSKANSWWYTLDRREGARKIYYHRANAFELKQEIATLNETENGIDFKWTSDDPARDFLRNCAFRLKRDDIESTLFLRKQDVATASLFSDLDVPDAGGVWIQPFNIEKQVKYLPALTSDQISLELVPNHANDVTIRKAGKGSASWHLWFSDVLVVRYTLDITPLDKPSQLKISATFLGAALDEVIVKDLEKLGQLPPHQKIDQRMVYSIDYQTVRARLANIKGDGLSDLGQVHNEIAELNKSPNKENKQKLDAAIERRKALEEAADQLERLQAKWKKIGQFRVDWLVNIRLGNHDCPLARSETLISGTY